MVAVLVNEPFSLPMSEIRNLTMRQVADCYLCERDKETGWPTETDDEVQAQPQETMLAPEDAFRLVKQQQGIPDYAMRRLWREHQAKIEARKQAREG